MAATFTKPSTTPRWADDGTPGQIVVPASGKQDLGWIFEEEPPFSFFNWHQNLTGEWIKWLGERLDDGIDENTFIIRNPNNASAFIELDGPNETIDFDGTSSPLTLDLSGIDPLISSGILGFGDENFQIDFNAGNPRIVFDALDELSYDRSGNAFAFTIAGIDEAIVRSTGINILNGLFVGDLTTAPTNDTVHVVDSVFGLDFQTATQPKLIFDTGDQLEYFRSTNTFSFIIGAITEVNITASGLNVRNGAHVGDNAVTPADDALTVGADIDFGLAAGADQQTLLFDVGDRFIYTRTTDLFAWVIAGTARLTLDATNFLPGITGVVSLGSSSLRWSEQHAEASIVHDFATRDPASAADIGRRVVNNTVVACGGGTSSGGIINPTTDSIWNVSTIVRVSLGRYAVTYTRALTAVGVSIAHLLFLADRKAQVTVRATTGIEVNVTDLDSPFSLVDGNFGFVTFGGGSPAT